MNMKYQANNLLRLPRHTSPTTTTYILFNKANAGFLFEQSILRATLTNKYSALDMEKSYAEGNLYFII